jgi:predicted heme/steroid binding protein
VDGVVYDVTGSVHWHGGHHHDCPLDCMAGQDLSEEIAQAPARMRASLQNFPVVGIMAP